MSEVTLPRKARGLTLPAALVGAALIALLAFAPLASATPDPVASGNTKLTLQKSFAQYLKTFGIKISCTGAAKAKGTTVTLPVSGGSVDPTTGTGTLTHNGGLRLTAGKTKVTIGALEINTSKKTLSGKTGGRTLQLAKLGGVSFARNGFGVNLAAKKLQLTPTAANALNKKLGFAGGKPLPFLKNKQIGSSKSEEQPKTVTLLPGGAVTFALDAELAKKLADVKVELVPLAGTTVLSVTPPDFSLPVTGGTFGPTGAAGKVKSAGGLLLAQKLPKDKEGKTFEETSISLGEFQSDLAAKNISAAVAVTSNASMELNRGALGRTSVADLRIGAVIADPLTCSVAVQNSSAVLQALSGEVLNGFVKIYAANVAEMKKAEGKEAEGRTIAAKILAEDAIAGGNPLGLISFSAQAQ